MIKPRLVMKFGGTSVSTTERIKNIAKKIKQEADNGYNIAVVVSAMSGITNKLIGYVNNITSQFDEAEYDRIVSSGEMVTAGLTALSLQEIGLKARSYSGDQIPIKTSGSHSKARIMDICSNTLTQCLESDNIAVIAGFQGINEDTGRITTLGRGGSDTSAVAIGAAIKAQRCDIYTDVNGVYTTDPSIESKARKIPIIAYEEMLEYASLGAKVLQTRSVELAMAYNLPVQVLSSMEDVIGSDLPGTLVCKEEDIMEQQLVTGIAYTKDESKITLLDVADTPGIASDVFVPLADAELNVDMIVQNIAANGKTTDVTFTVPHTDKDKAIKTIENHKDRIDFKTIDCNENVSKVSIIGVGMRSHAGIAATMFKTLAEKGINIQVITTSEIKISVLISSEYTELAVRALHSAFKLEE